MRLSVHIRERPFSNANLKKGQIMIDEASIRVMLSGTLSTSVLCREVRL